MTKWFTIQKIFSKMFFTFQLKLIMTSQILNTNWISQEKKHYFLCEIRKTIIVHQRLHFQRLSFFSGRNRPRWLKNYKNAFTELESNSFSSIFLIVDIIYSLKLKISRSKCLQLFKQEYTGNMTDNMSWQTITIFYKSSL